MQILALIGDTFRESRNTRLFWVLIAISTVFVAALASVGFDSTGMTFMFGVWHVDHPVLQLGRPEVSAFYGAVVSNLLIDLYIGWVGVVLALIATCGMFPAIMSSGSVELLLSKPISRWKLFIGKYLGALGFVGVQAAYLILLVILVIGVRSGQWNWGCLWCIPLLVLLFSYVYCVAVLVAVRNPSTLTCLLAALAFWFLCFLAQAGDQLLKLESPFVVTVESAGNATRNPAHSSSDSLSAPTAPSPTMQRVRGIVHAAYEVLPKTGEITVICSRVLKAANITEIVSYFDPDEEVTLSEMEQIRTAEAVEAAINPTHSILTSLAFEAAVLLIAGWMFCRRDF